MLYLDTSILVAAVSREASTPRVLAWLGKLSDGLSDADLVATDWSLTEVASALSWKLRMGTITLAEQTAARAGFSTLVSDQLQILQVERADFSAASRMVERRDMAMRAPDALHLAVAGRNGAAFATLDRLQEAAARAAGLSVVDV